MTNTPLNEQPSAISHIWYLHGFRSSAQSNKVEILKQYFPNCDIHGLEYEPHNPDQAANQIHKRIASLNTTDELLVLGTSLGGFWSRYIAHQYKVNALLINPSLHPDITLPVGVFYNYDDHEKEVSVSEEIRQTFNQYKISERPSSNVETFLAMDDEVISSKQSFLELYQDYPIHTYPTGKHRFTNFEKIIPAFIQAKFLTR